MRNCERKLGLSRWNMRKWFIRSVCVLFALGSFCLAETVESAPAEAIRAKAEHGDIDAQVALGNAYLQGKGVPIDKAEAAKWYRMAANNGDARAQLWLDLTYAYGDG
jgi:TPR repeat protein